MDNALRPRLVGQDTKMPNSPHLFLDSAESCFRRDGFHPGPILAALFVTAWEMFGTAFQRVAAPSRESRERLARRRTVSGAVRQPIETSALGAHFLARL
jgi:hypothetical protein